MRNRGLGLVVALAALVSLATPSYVAAQGAAAKTWNPPRTPDGQPDIQGAWGQRSDITTYSIQAGAIDREEHTRIGGQATQFGRPIVDPPDGMIPFTPEGAKKYQSLRDQHDKPTSPEFFDPVSRCLMEGVPRIVYQGGHRVIQTKDYIVFAYKYGHHYRVVYLDGRPHLTDNLKLWMGSSRGRWEGNTLVVEVNNHNEKTWFDIVGSHHSDAMKIVERYTFSGPDQIEYVATIEDPKTFTRPWKLAISLGRNKLEEQWESAVCEGNKAVHVAFGLPFDDEKK